MAHYQGNNAYLIINSVNVSPYWMDCDVEITAEEQDLSAGAGLNYAERGPGLLTITITGTLEYSDSNLASYITSLKPGSYTLDFGPENNTTGKPRINGTFYIQSSGVTGLSVAKTPVNVTFSAASNGNPTYSLWDAGGVF